MHPDKLHIESWRYDRNPPARGRLANLIEDRRVCFADRWDYATYRPLLYALGAISVRDTLVGGVDVIVNGAPVQKARKSHPDALFVKTSTVMPLVHQELASFHAFLRALVRHGFCVRNPGDEGEPESDYFELPLIDDSVHATLLHYLATSPFIRGFTDRRTPSRGRDSDAFTAFAMPDAGRTWYYVPTPDAWARVSALRGEDEMQTELKGAHLLLAAAAFWSRRNGLYFFEHPDPDSVEGLFIQAGVSQRTGRVEGVAVSRTWT